jgi:hypothetical protein
LDEHGVCCVVPPGDFTCGGQHPRSDDVLDDADNVVREAPDCNGLVAKPAGWGFGHNGVARRTHADGVHESTDHQEDSDGEVRVVAIFESEPTNLKFEVNGVLSLSDKGLKGQARVNTYDNQDDKHGREARHVDCLAAKEREDKVADQHADHEACTDGDVDVEGLNLVEPCGLQEDHGVTCDRVTVQNLRHPCHAVL